MQQYGFAGRARILSGRSQWGQMMKQWLWMMLTGALMLPVHADESVGLQFPVEDAKAAVAAGNFEFAGIQLEDRMELPGLTPEQAERVMTKFKVKALNPRWRTFANIEQRPQELRRMQSYARRYNMMMWKEIDQHQLRDAKRYRY